MNNIQLFVKKIRQFITKDVADENESGQFYIMMRIYYIITACYILVFDIIALSAGLLKYMPVLLVWLPLHIMSFFTTYRFSRRVVFHIFSMGLTVWMLLAVYLLGWDYGAQYFMYPLIVISFFATDKNARGKAVYTAYVCLLHLSMFIYAREYAPKVSISVNLSYGLQVLNTVTLFLCMYVICLMFSNTSQAALQKLAFYNQKLKTEAETDALTGLMNRRCMYQELDERVENHQGKYFAIAMGDIDFFKKINDTKGHNCGDHVLRTISQYFKEYMEGKGIVCRWGGEEFLFLFRDINGDVAYNYVLEMKNHLEELPIVYKDETIHITMTFGVEEYDFQSPVTYLIKQADDKLYMGKNNGRNQVVY